LLRPFIFRIISANVRLATGLKKTQKAARDMSMTLLIDRKENGLSLDARRFSLPKGTFLLFLLTSTCHCVAIENLTNEWSLGTSTWSDTCPAIAQDGTIYFGTFTGRLWAVRPNGSRKWIFRAGLEIKSSPGIGADGTIYFGSRDHKFYALRPNGEERWEFLTGGWVDSSPALAKDGTICFGSWDKNF